MKGSGLSTKLHNISLVPGLNLTEGNDLNSTLSAIKHNVTQHLKNVGHRTNSSRALERLLSAKLTSSATSLGGKSNKTVPAVGGERISTNSSSRTVNSSNVEDTMERRAVQLSVANVTDKASAFIGSLPSLLSNATSNVTSWAMNLIGRGNDSSSLNGTSRVRSTVELEALKNSTDKNRTADDSTVSEQKQGTPQVEVKHPLVNSSSLLNHTAVVIKRGTNQTLDAPVEKLGNLTVNATNEEVSAHNRSRRAPFRGKQLVFQMPTTLAPSYMSTPAPYAPMSPAYGAAQAYLPPTYSVAENAPSYSPAYGVTEAPPSYGMPPAATSYQQESYYTAAQPTYTARPPYVSQSATEGYYAPSAGYAAQYGYNAPAHPSATASPWF